MWITRFDLSEKNDDRDIKGKINDIIDYLTEMEEKFTSDNSQSTPCSWCDGVRTMLNHSFCSNCGRDLR